MGCVYCVGERNKGPSKCFGFVDAKAGNWTGCSPILVV